MIHAPDTPPSSRATAARIVGRWLKTGEFPDRLIAPGVADRSFVVEVAYGVARWRRALEWALGRLADRAPEAALRPYLLTGLYQVLFMDHIAAYAAVSETVQAAKALRPAAAGFANAVLRRAAREREALREALAAEPLGVRESHPDALLDAWRRQFGDARTEALCRWDNTRPQVTVRPNSARIGAGEFAAALAQAGIGAVPHPFAASGCLALPHGVRVEAVPGYAEGWFTVQDPSTTVAVDLLDPRPGMRVLDACAAPGGKTALLAERMRGEGRLAAMDVHEDRLAALRENLLRLGLTRVEVVHGDASDAALPGGGAFDRILLDVPCTNTGVLRRRPDARWRFSPERLGRLAAAQRRLLDAAAGRVAPGGRIVYSTCSLQAEEDGEQVRAWLAQRPDFSLEREIALFPPDTQTDGAYAAALRKSECGSRNAERSIPSHGCVKKAIETAREDARPPFRMQNGRLLEGERPREPFLTQSRIPNARRASLA